MVVVVVFEFSRLTVATGTKYCIRMVAMHVPVPFAMYQVIVHPYNQTYTKIEQNTYKVIQQIYI